jgi:hypothetical protein
MPPPPPPHPLGASTCRYGNLPGLTMTEGEHVRWHVLGLGNQEDLHTPVSAAFFFFLDCCGFSAFSQTAADRGKVLSIADG